MQVHNAAMEDKEVWKQIEGHAAYWVSSHGRVLSKKRIKAGKEMTQHSNQHGYRRVALKENGINHWRSVHRLVAIAFIPNPCTLPQVNHINANKADNNWRNLEWITNADNMRHAAKLGLKAQKKAGQSKLARRVQCIETGEVFESIIDAAKKYDVYPSMITAVCARRRNKTAGLRWIYLT